MVLTASTPVRRAAGGVAVMLGTDTNSSPVMGNSQVWFLDQQLPPLVYQGHRGRNWISDAAFSPDSTRVVTIADDRTARIWSISWPELLSILQRSTTACLQPEQRVQLLLEDRETALMRSASCEKRQGREP
jgi:WD40 repeat protein